MSFPKDIEDMHRNFGTYGWLADATPVQKKELMKLRMRMLSEEFNETLQAYLQSDEEEMIDGLIDLCVIAIGTLDIANVDVERAWTEVFVANMGKKVGVKSGRPNPLGLPDLVKPSSWTSPDHGDNYGNLKEFL